MAKIIFTSQYMKGELPEHLKHYVKYIATRDGVEKLDESKKLLPATERQKRLIQRLLRDFPDAKQLLEYEDYKQRTTRENASDFISQVMERYVALCAKRENYVDYIGTRPGVEQSGSHGLFTDAGEPVVLSAVQKEVADHKGVIWTHVISLHREDAARLGYDEGKAWRALLRSKRAMFCREMKIDSKNLKWYAAFHNESHHPHVHVMVYSKKESEGYLTKTAIQNMRAEFAHDIFRQEFLQIYKEQKASRTQLMEETISVLQKLAEGKEPNDISETFQKDFIRLAERLNRTKGKKVYGYLKADVKRLVDRLTDELAEAPEIQEAYRVWRQWQDAVGEIYGQGERPKERKLSQEPKLKVLKNRLIQSAVHLLDLPDGQMVCENEWKIGLHDKGGNEQQLLQEAEQGNSRAQYILGNLYWQTRLDEGDLEKAVWYLEKAQQNGNSAAGILLGRIYSDRKEAYYNFQRAVELLLIAAETNDAWAQFFLGRLYWQERHKAGQEELAQYWLERAAEGGNAYAKTFLEAIQTSFEEQALAAGKSLLRELSKLFRQELGQLQERQQAGIDKKRRRKLQQKRAAHGQKEDDGIESQTT